MHCSLSICWSSFYIQYNILFYTILTYIFLSSKYISIWFCYLPFRYSVYPDFTVAVRSGRCWLSVVYPLYAAFYFNTGTYIESHSTKSTCFFELLAIERPQRADVSQQTNPVFYLDIKVQDLLCRVHLRFDWIYGLKKNYICFLLYCRKL